MDVVAEILQKSGAQSEKYKSTAVVKHIDVEYDVGALVAFDTNELDAKKLR